MIATEIAEVSGNLVPIIATCGVMGSGLTMALAVAVTGMMMHDGATARAVKIARDSLRPPQIMTLQAFENACRSVRAAGG